MRKTSFEGLKKSIHDLLNEGRVRQARGLIKRELSRSSKSKSKHAVLLDLLLDIETYASRPRDALRILEARRSLGYKSFSESASAKLLTAMLLSKTNQWFAARSVFIDLLRDRRALPLSGLVLDAMSGYVDADQQCREEMRTLLEARYKTEAKRLGIADAADDAAIEDKVRKARFTLRTSRQMYQHLVARALTGKAEKADSSLIRELEEFGEGTPIMFFRAEAQKLLKRLRGKEINNRRDKKSQSDRRRKGSR